VLSRSATERTPVVKALVGVVSRPVAAEIRGDGDAHDRHVALLARLGPGDCARHHLVGEHVECSERERRPGHALYPDGDVLLEDAAVRPVLEELHAGDDAHGERDPLPTCPADELHSRDDAANRARHRLSTQLKARVLSKQRRFELARIDGGRGRGRGHVEAIRARYFLVSGKGSNREPIEWVGPRAKMERGFNARVRI
jgi:hypothetical protein